MSGVRSACTIGWPCCRPRLTLSAAQPCNTPCASARGRASFPRGGYKAFRPQGGASAAGLPSWGHGTQQVSYFIVPGISQTARTLHISQKCQKLQSSWSFSSILWVTWVLPKLQYAFCFTNPVNMVLSLLWASVTLGSVPGCHGPLGLYCDREANIVSRDETLKIDSPLSQVSF